MNTKKTPQICRVSPFNSGETAQIYGKNLKNSVLYWYQPSEDFDKLCYKEDVDWFKLPPENAVTINPEYIFEHIAYFNTKSEEDTPIKSGCALVWLKNEFGFSNPFIVNRPEIWSVSLKNVEPGERLFLFGVNFRLYGKKKCVISGNNLITPIEISCGFEAIMDSVAPNSGDFKSEIRIPDSLEDGEYEIRIHNGTGGDYGWSEPYKINVKNEKSYIEFCNKKWNFEPEHSKNYDTSKLLIKTISSKYEGGFIDATAEIQSAIDEVSNLGGGIVRLPHGIFGLTKTLILKPNVVLKGAGRCATTLTVAEGKTIKRQTFPVNYASKKGSGSQWAADWKPSFESRNATPFILIYTDAGIEDLMIEDTNGCFASVMVGNIDGDISKNVFFNKVNINEAARHTLTGYQEFAPDYCILTVSHTENFSIFKCNIIGPNPLFMLHAKQNFAHIIGNTFDVSPRQFTEVSVNGANNCMIEQNSFLNGRRTLMCQSSFNCNWIYQNRGYGVHRSGNNLEAYMAENGAGAWTGKAESIFEDAIELSFDFENYPLEFKGRLGHIGENFDDLKTFICIIKGKGLGQYRKVKEVVGNKILLEDKWDVMPDDTTVFSYIYPSWHNLWVNNNQEMSGGHSQFFYGAGVDNVIAGHQTALAAGILCQATTEMYDGEIVSGGVLAYNRFLNCETRASGKGIELRAARYDLNKHKRVYEGQPDCYNETMSIWGNIFRGNVFGGSSDTYYVKNQLSWYLDKNPACMEIEGAYNIFEGNHILNYENAFYLGDTGEGNFFNNKIIGAKKIFAGNGIPIGIDAQNDEKN